MKNTLKIGTRNSPLALVQTNIVIQEIKRHFPKIHCEIVPIITTGDLIQDKNLYEIGGKALFLKEIEHALLHETIDLAVHSLKDVPGRIAEDLVIDAMLEREDPRDVFICMKYQSIAELPANSTIGTSSVRRKIFLERMRRDLHISICRGNIDTRIKKLKNNEIDAIILAYSGLKRTALFDNRYCYLIDINQMLPAVGQGVITIERRRDDSQMQEICSAVNHQATWQLMQAERAFLEYLDADCRTPISAYSQYINKHIQVNFMLGQPGTDKIIFHEEIGEIHDAPALGVQAAKIMSI